jgi:hypothetical protein
MDFFQDPGSALVFCLVFVGFCLPTSIFTAYTLCRKRKALMPVLPIYETRVAESPSSKNPFLKLRMNTYSRAEEQLTLKPNIYIDL